MASSAPTTSSLRRSFSLPVSRQSSSPDPQIEVLFNLPSARIVAFSTSHSTASPDLRPGSSNGRSTLDAEVGTLSWVSRFERTIAVGNLSIYRAPGSVAFLSCANALKPILPKSQAWCVDGDSKIVLQIRPPQYWRIEVPNKTADEVLKVEELKRVLKEVLRFERTPCPFQRNFTVELPQSPETPVKRKPWKPVGKPTSEFIPSAVEDFRTLGRSLSCSPTWGPDTSKSRSPSRLGVLDEETGSVVLGIEPPVLDHDIDLSSMKISDIEPSSSKRRSQHVEVTALEPSPLEFSIAVSECSDYSDHRSETIDSSPKPHVPSTLKAMVAPSSEIQKGDSNSRSITAPPILSLVTSPPSSTRPISTSPSGISNGIELDSAFSSSVESFHSTQSWHSPLEPHSPHTSDVSSPSLTYPYPHEEFVLSKRMEHPHDLSEGTVIPETPRLWERVEANSEVGLRRIISLTPKTPTLSHDGSDRSDEEQSEILTPPTARKLVQHRATTSSNSRRRALSPLPPAVNIFSPPRRDLRRMNSSRHLPTAIIQKTCEILLSPPSHLFHLMISIASKIAAGEWCGFLSGHGEAVHWDFEDEYGTDSLFGDDYGITLPKPQPKARSRKSSRASGHAPGGWEVD